MNSPTATATVTAFVGRALRGPINSAVHLHSFADYQRVFGGLWQPSPMSYAVEQYFEHGGQHAVVVRVANGARPTTLSLPCGGETLLLEALVSGSREFLRASVDYDNLRSQDHEYFNLVIQRVRMHRSEHIETQESFRRVSINPATGRFVAAVLVESHLVRVVGAVPACRPDPTPGIKASYMVGYVDSNPDGSDGAPLSDYDLIGSASDNSGLFALSTVERFDFLYLPPLSRERDVGMSSLLVALRYCRERHAMLIVDPPAQWTSHRHALEGLRDFNFSSDQAVMFFPRLLHADKLRGRPEVFPNGGAVAGLLSRVDESRPVWEAGLPEPELVVRPGVRLQVELSEVERWRMANHGINCLHYTRRVAPVQLLRRTLAGGVNASIDWAYLTPRRLALHITGTLERSTRWVLLASPSRSMWARVVRQVTEFMRGLAAIGAFPAARRGQEFFVVCDSRVNAPRIDAPPEINILVGYAAAQPDQYHCFMITHRVDGSRTRTVAVNRYETSSTFEDEQLTATLLALPQSP